MFLPKTLDRSVTDGAYSMFPDSWLEKPDDIHLPSLDTPGVLPSPSGEYGRYESNFMRFAAQEITKRLDLEQFQTKGFMLQAIAAGWHHKSAAQLKDLGDKIGRERISVMHGTEDRMITVHHGHVLIEELKPGSSWIKEGSGHIMMLEISDWHNEKIEGMFEKTEAMKTD
jgi:hypothetical protein